MAYKFSTLQKITAVFVFAGIIVFIILLLLTARGVGILVEKTSYYTIVNSASGLKPGMPVLYKGIAIGRLSKLELSKDDRVIVKFYVKKEYASKIRKGSVVVIKSSLLGGKSFEILPGEGKPFEAEAEIPSQDTPEGRKILAKKGLSKQEQIGAVVSDVHQFIKILKDPEGPLLQTLMNLQKTTHELKQMPLLTKQQKLVKKIDRALSSFEAAARDLRVVARRLRQMPIIGEKQKQQVMEPVRR